MTGHLTTLDHQSAQRLAATALDWPLSGPDDAALAAHLRSCPACRGRIAQLGADARSLRLLDLGDAPERVRTRVATHAGTIDRRRGLGRGTAWLAAAALVLVTLGTTIVGGVGGSRGEGRGPGEAASPSPDIVFQTEVVRFTATDLWIDAAGRRFVGVGPVSTGDSDPGAEARSLSLEWTEHSTGMRIRFYFASDGAEWWVREIRTNDGTPAAEQVFAYGRFFSAPTGQAWTGDLDVDLEDPKRGARASLHIRGMTLSTAPFVSDPPVDGAPVPARLGPFDPGGALRCAGILQLPALEAEQELLRRGIDDFRWRLNRSPVVELDSLKGIEDPVIVFPGASMLADGSIALWVLPAKDPNAVPMPVADDCPAVPSAAP